MEEESVKDAHRLLWRAKYRGKTLVRFRVALSAAVARFPPKYSEFAGSLSSTTGTWYTAKVLANNLVGH